MYIVHTFLYWMAVCLAFSLNIALLMGVHRMMQDRHDARAAAGDVLLAPAPAEDDGLSLAAYEEELRRIAEARMTGARSETCSVTQEPRMPQFKMPDVKVESSFGSGKLGKQ